jgi:halocyanin-like protein
MTTRKDTRETDPRLGRRTVLRAGATTVAAVGAGVGVAGTATAQSSFGGWMDGVGNYDGSVADRTGQDSVTVQVGTQANGGAFGFGPPAVRVDPGTEVVWEWTGEGGQHNVVAEEGAGFESDLTGEAGFTFSQTFDAEGVIKYSCAPHRSLGMKGVVVVGSMPGGGGGGGGADAQPDYGGWFEGVDNYDGTTVDRRGQDSVTITVGAQGNGGAFAYDPPAVWIDPGTEVVWEWTGEGGQHNVAAEEGAGFESDLTSEAGFTFSQTFEETGIVTYYCTPHRSLGMKGALAVGDDVPTTTAGGGGETPSGGGAPAEGGDGFPGGAGGLVGYLLAFGLPGLAVASILFGEFYGSIRNEEVGDVAREAPAAEPVTEIGHDEFDPVGTASLIIVYFLILLVMWVFVYFVEFLGGGPTITG